MWAVWRNALSSKVKILCLSTIIETSRWVASYSLLPICDYTTTGATDPRPKHLRILQNGTRFLLGVAQWEAQSSLRCYGLKGMWYTCMMSMTCQWKIARIQDWKHNNEYVQGYCHSSVGEFSEQEWSNQVVFLHIPQQLNWCDSY